MVCYIESMNGKIFKVKFDKTKGGEFETLQYGNSEFEIWSFWKNYYRNGGNYSISDVKISSQEK